MNAIAWLKKIEGIENNIESVSEMRKRIFDKVTKITKATDGERVQGGAGNKQEELLVQLAGADEKLLDWQLKLEEAKNERIDAIREGVSSPTGRAVLLNKYVLQLPWERMSYDMGKSRNTLLTFHHRALKELERYLTSKRII